MAAAGDLHPFGQQRLTLPLQIGAGEGDIAMAIDYPMQAEWTLPADASAHRPPGAPRAANQPAWRHRHRS